MRGGICLWGGRQGLVAFRYAPACIGRPSEETENRSQRAYEGGTCTVEGSGKGRKWMLQANSDSISAWVGAESD